MDFAVTFLPTRLTRPSLLPSRVPAQLFFIAMAILYLVIKLMHVDKSG